MFGTFSKLKGDMYQSRVLVYWGWPYIKATGILKNYVIQFGDQLGQLFEWVSAIWKLAISILGPLGLYHCCHPYRHTFHQSLNFLWLYLILHFCHSIPKLPNSLGLCWKLAKLYFNMLLELRSGECSCQSRRVILLSFIQVLAFWRCVLNQYPTVRWDPLQESHILPC